MKETYHLHLNPMRDYWYIDHWSSGQIAFCRNGVTNFVTIPARICQIELVISTRPLDQQSLEITWDTYDRNTFIDGRYCIFSFDLLQKARHALGLPEKKFYATIYYEEKV